MNRPQLLVHIAIIVGGLAVAAIGIFGSPLTNAFTNRMAALQPSRRSSAVLHRAVYITLGCLFTVYGLYEVLGR
jgi:hypothetical protein